MLTWLRWLNQIKSRTGLFGSQPAEQKIIYAPGTKISYDPGLVSRLKEDHEQLVTYFKRMLKAGETGDYTKITFNMDAFLILFNSHALTEYTKLYIFLDHAFKKDEENYELIREFKREMTDIGRAVRAFSNKWVEQGIDDDNLQEFIKEANQIAKVLVRRIKTEEERLYEIYDMAPGIFTPVSVRH